MIRFIDLRGQIINDDEPHFAFYDTITDKFLSFGGEQEFTSYHDFHCTGAVADTSIVSRCLALIPKGYFNNPPTIADTEYPLRRTNRPFIDSREMSKLTEHSPLCKTVLFAVNQPDESECDCHVAIAIKLSADTERLDWLQSQSTDYGKGWICRMSTTGRGMRLHQTFRPDAQPDVREAIDAAMLDKREETND